MKPIFFIPLLSLSLIAVNSLTISDPCEALLSAYSSVDQAFNALQVSCPTVTVVLNTDAAYSASAAKILNIKSSTASTSSLKLKASQDRATVESKIAFNFNENFASVTLDGLKFTGLTSPISSKSPLVLTGCSFKNGRGVISSLVSDTITGVNVSESTFTNVTPLGSGPALSAPQATVFVSRSSFIGTIGRAISAKTIQSSACYYDGNSALGSNDQRGGAIMASSIITYKDVFANNKAVNGGALFSSTTVTSELSTFDANQCLGGFGGAIYAKSVIINGGNSFTRNTASADATEKNGFGGAIYTNSIVVNHLSNITFNYNSAKRGGAIYSFMAKVLGGSYSSNIADLGGAIFSQTAEVSESAQFVQNSAKFGNSVYVTAGPFSLEMSHQDYSA